MMTKEEKQKNMMNYYRKDVEKEINEIKDGNVRNFKEHVCKNHLNVTDSFLMRRIIEDKNIEAASSILDISIEELCFQIGEWLSRPDVKEGILEYLTWPREDWDITEKYPSGSPYHLWIPMPENASGHKYLRSHSHNWSDGPILCTAIQVTIIRNTKYTDAKIFRNHTRERPFIIMTAFSI